MKIREELNDRKSKLRYRNYELHERQRRFTVFYFYNKATADYFESCLIERDIPYERGSGPDLVKRHLIGVHEKFLGQAVDLNEESMNMYRRPFLGNITFRNVLLIFTFLVLLLALIGYFVRG